MPPPFDERLNQLLWFRPHPGPTPDPASLLQFLVEVEQPVRQQVVSAYLQMALDTLQAQVKFVQNVQQSLSANR
jgi:hypothetical protein